MSAAFNVLVSCSSKEVILILITKRYLLMSQLKSAATVKPRAEVAPVLPHPQQEAAPRRRPWTTRGHTARRGVRPGTPDRRRP